MPNLMLQFFQIVIINAIVIHRVCTNQKSSPLQFLHLLPCHRSFPGALYCFLRKELNVFCIIILNGISKVRINKKHGIYSISFQLGRNLRITILQTVIKRKSYCRLSNNDMVNYHVNRRFKIDEFTILVKLLE